MNVDYSDDLFAELESLGRDALKHCGFALVGGGIGERLNSKFIKLSLTSDLVRDYTFLEDYCRFFHAIEVQSFISISHPDNLRLPNSPCHHDK